jgi:hypothetical protein
MIIVQPVVLLISSYIVRIQDIVDPYPFWKLLASDEVANFEPNEHTRNR